MNANTSTMANVPATSYVDMEKLTAPDFNQYSYANSLVLSTNNPSDNSMDLTTPLSKALFDLQEIDSNIHTLTSRSALDILTYTSTQNASATRILEKVEGERIQLNASYARLESDVLGKYTKATNARLHAERSHQVLKLGRSVQRILTIARQFEAQITDSGVGATQSGGVGKPPIKEDHRLLLQATYTLLYFRTMFTGKDADMLAKINLVRSVRGRVFEDGEAKILEYARKVVREFSISSLTSATGASFSEAEDARARFTSAAHILYLLSRVPNIDGSRIARENFEPEYMLRALQAYLQSAIQSSAGGIGRGLGQLPTLDRALLEASARCQNVVALEALLRKISPPHHPLLFSNDGHATKSKDNDGNLSDNATTDEDDSEDEQTDTSEESNLLDLLLDSLDTPSLPSYFWRSLASSLSSRVQEILSRGGVSARTLRANKESVRNEIRECVLRGSRLPGAVVSATTGKSGKEQVIGNWEREAAVMIGSVMTPLNK